MTSHVRIKARLFQSALSLSRENDISVIFSLDARIRSYLLVALLYPQVVAVRSTFALTSWSSYQIYSRLIISTFVLISWSSCHIQILIVFYVSKILQLGLCFGDEHGATPIEWASNVAWSLTVWPVPFRDLDMFSRGLGPWSDLL